MASADVLIFPHIAYALPLALILRTTVIPMTKRRKRAYSILFIILTTLTAGVILNSSAFRNKDNILNRIQCIIFNKNTISVSTTKINVDSIKIESMEEGKVVFKDGKMTSNIKNQYGGDNFKIFYNEKLIGQAGIFKTNWWHTHDYHFNILRTKNNITFYFKVEGPDRKSLYFKHFEIDSLNRKSTEIFYNSKGKTGQINIEYYNKSGLLIVDEIWENDTLITMNLYSNGKWSKNYTTNKYSKNEKYNLIKTNNTDSLVYIYETITDNVSKNERISIKN
jgi:hypothetical protein